MIHFIDLIQLKVENKFIAALLFVSVVFLFLCGLYIYQQTTSQLTSDSERELQFANKRIIESITTTIKNKASLGKQLNSMLVEKIEAGNSTTNTEYTRQPDNTIRMIDPLTTTGVFVPAKNDLDKKLINIHNAAKSLHKEVFPLVQLSFLNIHYTTSDSNLILTPAGNWITGVEANFEASNYPFYYWGDTQHNPSRNAKWTPLYYDKLVNTWMTTLIVPYYVGNELQGISGNDYDLEQVFVEFLKLAKNEQGITSFLFDSHGNFIVHPNYKQQINNSWQQLNTLLTADTITEDWVSIFFQDYFQKKANSTVHNNINVSKNDYLAIATPVGFLDWHIGSYKSRNLVTAATYPIFIQTLTGAFFYLLLLIFLIAYLIKKLIVSRIATLITYVENFSIDQTTTPPTMITGKDEIQQLATTFYTMGELVHKNINALNMSEKRYRTFFENSSDPMIIIKDEIFIDCNMAAVKLLQYDSVDDLLQKKPGQLSPKFQTDGMLSATKATSLFNITLTRGSHRFEWNHLSKNGDIIPVEISLTAIPTEKGMVLHTVWRDISARKQTMEKLNYLAHHHPLTGLPNRLLLTERLKNALQLAKRENSRGAVLFLDLDNFKKINDSLGHNAGDEVLKIIAQRLLEQCHQADTVAHLSGDEFVVILQNINATGNVTVKAQQILDCVQRPFIVDDYELFISCSIGIVEFDGDCSSIEDLLKNADATMYAAKSNGKNCFQQYSAKSTDSAMQKMVLESQLRHALARNELVVHYQPQVTLPQGNIVAVEALMRWQHPTMGLVPPDDFIPLSEETGLIIPMGEWIMFTACKQLVEWRKQGIDIHRVAVNLSGRQLQLDSLPQTVQKILHQTGCPAYCLELEITEGFIMRHPEQSIAMLQQVQELGVELSVDDFGTGHSSLNYLKRLPINRLKIDRSFVSDIGVNTNGETIIRAIIAMGHSLNLAITAEGIETDLQRKFLEDLHCNEAQGYLFNKPLPATKLIHHLRLPTVP